MVDMNNIEQFVEQLKAPVQDTNKTYTAVVSRKDNSGIVWVYLAGSNMETPTASTSSEVESGDVVNVEWRNNKLFIVGNSTNPSAGIIRVQAVEHATEVANQAASNAVQSAGQAREAADNAIASAGQARTAAAEATETAATAGRAASAAQAAADAAMETANTKKTVFVTEPTPPYHVGDLWVKFDPEVFDMVDSNGNNLVDDQGDLFEAAILKEAAAYVCMVPKLAGQAFDESDFELATADNGLREWFWHDASGAHILGDVTGFRNDLTSTGMNIVDTSTESSVAEFASDHARIGSENDYNIAIQPSAINMVNGKGLTGFQVYATDSVSNYDFDQTIYSNYNTNTIITLPTLINHYIDPSDYPSGSGYTIYLDGVKYTSSAVFTAKLGIIYKLPDLIYIGTDVYFFSTDGSISQDGFVIAYDDTGTLTISNNYEPEPGYDTLPFVNSFGYAQGHVNNLYVTGEIKDGQSNVLSNKLESSDILPLFEKVSVNKTFTVSANSTQNQSFAPAAADVPSGYTRVGLCGWNTANGNVFIVTCTGTTITFGNKSSSQVTCNNAQVDWLYIRSSI